MIYFNQRDLRKASRGVWHLNWAFENKDLDWGAAGQTVCKGTEWRDLGTQGLALCVVCLG